MQQPLSSTCGATSTVSMHYHCRCQSKQWSFLLLLLLLLPSLSTSIRLLPHARREQEKAAYTNSNGNKNQLLNPSDQHAQLNEYHKQQKLLQEKKKKRRQNSLFRRGAASASSASSSTVDFTSVLFPGMTPELYEPNERVELIADLVQSKKTHVPYQFYNLPGCPNIIPTKLSSQHFHRRIRQMGRKNLGAKLTGVDWTPAPYPIKVLQNISCTALCQVDIQPRSIKWLRKLVRQHYRIHLSLDQLPVLLKRQHVAVRGYPIGFAVQLLNDQKSANLDFFLYNHLRFIITYQKTKQQDQKGNGSNENGIYITGFSVEPVSIQHSKDGPQCRSATASESPNEDKDQRNTDKPIIQNDPKTYLPLRVGGDVSGEQHMRVIYSYEVEWHHQPHLQWADRWDIYLAGDNSSHDDDIHTFSILNSLLIVMFLTGSVAIIMIRVLRRDLAAANGGETDGLLGGGSGGDAIPEETGWKLVHGDVFRAPSSHPAALCVLVGTGVQLATAVVITLLVALARLLNPLKKGQFLTAILVVYVLCGSVSGYVAARLYVTWTATGTTATSKGNTTVLRSWHSVAVATAAVVPGCLLLIFLMLNTILSVAGAATAVHFAVLVKVFLLWGFVATPLVLLGSWVGGQLHGALAIPTRIHSSLPPRPIPKERPWYTRLPGTCVLGGLLPFASVVIEVFYLLSALWLHQLYYVMGTVMAVFLILLATTAQVSIVLTYFQLLAEDHRWMWRSFWNTASAGAYVLLYAAYFWYSRLDLEGALPVAIYVIYMLILSALFGVVCGSVGFGCSFWFVQTIYGALKVD